MENEDYRIITLFNNTLKVYRDGRLQVLGNRAPNKGIFYDKKFGLDKGYFRLQLGFGGRRQRYSVHRIIAMAFLGLDIDSKLLIDHEHHNTTDNSVDNIRIATHSQNQMNKIAKGYGFHKGSQKYQASITLDGVYHYLGTFVTEEEAHQAYLQGRIKYFGEFA